MNNSLIENSKFFLAGQLIKYSFNYKEIIRENLTPGLRVTPSKVQGMKEQQTGGWLS
jgi:hypothetical protein